MSNPSDQREFTRIATALDADVVIAGVVHAGTTRDVSLKGSFVSCTDPLQVDEVCSIVIYLGGRTAGEAIRASGRVTRVQPGACAIEFSELDGPESYHHLTNVIRYNAQDQQRVVQEFDSHLGLKRIVPPGD